MTRKPISKETKISIFERDGWRCFYCGNRVFMRIDKFHSRKAVVDHVTAVANGGSNDLQNLTTACFRCNAEKSAQPLEVFRKTVQRKNMKSLPSSFFGETTETIEVFTLAAAQEYFDALHSNKVLNWMLFEIK